MYTRGIKSLERQCARADLRHLRLTRSPRCLPRRKRSFSCPTSCWPLQPPARRCPLHANIRKWHKLWKMLQCAEMWRRRGLQAMREYKSDMRSAEGGLCNSTVSLSGLALLPGLAVRLVLLRVQQVDVDNISDNTATQRPPSLLLLH